MWVKKSFILFFFFCLQGSAGCTGNIPDGVKKEYALDMQNAFILQSEGLSTSAMFHFEQGCMKAMKAGETTIKIEAIRKLFVWYRTFGFYAGLIKQDPKIVGQYLGGGRYASYSDYSHLKLISYAGNQQQKELITEYLFGTAQVLSGILCVWLLPPSPSKWALGISLTSQGVARIYDITKPLLFQQDISMIELKKAGETIRAAE